MVIEPARFDGLGRRVRKVVTNSGDLNGTTVYHWDNQQIVETRDGSANLVTQVYHGTRYIDEVIGERLPAGRVYVHQDANWNVTALTDLTGRVLERNWYSPYGELEVVHDAHPFDYDGDGDVDSTDVAKADVGGTCRGHYSAGSGKCKRLDADADGDVDGSDYTAVSAYASLLPSDGKLQRVPVSNESQLASVPKHQALPLDAEILSYQNRHRQYNTKIHRYHQSDPLATGMASLAGLAWLDSWNKAGDCTGNCGVPTGALQPLAGRGLEYGLSLYEYLHGNPVASVDSLGLRPAFVDPPPCCRSTLDIWGHGGEGGGSGFDDDGAPIGPAYVRRHCAERPPCCNGATVNLNICYGAADLQWLRSLASQTPQVSRICSCEGLLYCIGPICWYCVGEWVCIDL